MRKTILTLIAAIAATGVFADEKSEALLGALAKKVASWGEYRVEFTVTIDGQALAGSYEVMGEAYRVKTPDVLLFCDGVTKHEVSTADREVIIDKVDPNDRTVMGNPTRLFDFLDGSYTHRYMGVAVVGGVNCERIEISEAGVENGQQIEAFIAKATGVPVRVSYKIGIMETEAAVDVVRITPNLKFDYASFGYDPGLYAGYDVIDFR